MDVIWSAGLHNDAWTVQVVRVDYDTTRLEIIPAGTYAPVHSELIYLAYGTRFGPDGFEIEDWIDRAYKIIGAQVK